jgi:iron complex outermembrane receptor protein
MYNYIRKTIFFWGFLTAIPMAQESFQDTSLGSLESLLDMKICTAAKYSQTASQAPASVTIITADDIVAYGYQTLEDVMMYTRGFYTNNDRNYSYIGARGFGRPTDYNNRILLLINGHTINDNVYGSAPFGTEIALDLSTVERIEIVRGPGSALYGTGAMFAVVNIITKKGQTIDDLIISLKTGSYGKVIGSLIYGKECKNGMDLLISVIDGNINGQNLYYPEFDDPSTNYGTAVGLDQDKYYGLMTTLSYRSLSFQIFGTSREKEVPTAAWDVVFNASPSKTLDQWGHLEIKYNQPCGIDKNISFRSYYNRYYYKGWMVYDITQYDASTGEQIGGELQFSWDVIANNTLIMGTEYQTNTKVTYECWSDYETYFYKNKPSDAWALYIQDEYQLTENLCATFGIRHDGYSYGGNTTTPRGALVYRPFNSSALKLLYGESYRKATLYEMYYEDVFSGYKANLDLKPEKIFTDEIVWEQRVNKNITGVVSLYHYHMKNLIDQSIDADDSLKQYNNISKVTADGIELECNIRSQSGTEAFVNYAYQEAKDSKTKTRLTNSPNHLFKAGISQAIRGNLYVGGEFVYESERLTLKNTKTNSFALVNLNLRYSPSFPKYTNLAKINDKTEISFKVRNLFNNSYSLPAGLEHRQTSIRQDGRNYCFTLKLKF